MAHSRGVDTARVSVGGWRCPSGIFAEREISLLGRFYASWVRGGMPTAPRLRFSTPASQ